MKDSYILNQGPRVFSSCFPSPFLDILLRALDSRLEEFKSANSIIIQTSKPQYIPDTDSLLPPAAV